MIRNFKILTLISLILTLYSTHSFSAVGKGAATEYEVSIKRIWLCETGSTESSCLNKTLISDGAKSMDIAAVAAGVTAGTMGSLSKLVIGTTYTFIQVEMDRGFKITGTDGDCVTKTSNSASLTAFGTGLASSNDAQSTTLYVPGTDTQSASMGNNINGYRSSDGRTSAAGTIEDDDNYMWWRKEITGGLTLKTGRIPTLDMAFDVSEGVEGNHATCTNAHMNAAEPAITITFK